MIRRGGWLSLLALILALAAGLTATPLHAADEPAATAEQQAAVARMNAYRQRAGVAPLALHPALSRAAVNHATYYMLNAGDPALAGLGLHQETPGRPGYTGTEMQDRIQSAGYTGTWNESMALLGDPVGAVDAFMATVNHRLPILDPIYTDTGYGGGHEGRTVVDVLTYGGPFTHPPAPQWVAWPPDGYSGAATTYDGNEAPDAFPGAAYPVGGAITLKYTGAGTLTLDAAHVTDPAGRDLPVLTRVSYNFITRNTAVVATQQPLAPNTRYTVRLSGTIDGQPWTRAWSFSTGAGADGALPMPHPAPDTALRGVWARTDWPLAVNLAPARSWVWGPAGWETRQEPYAEAPGGQRLVRYYDKARMEITKPGGPSTDPWFVTNGLLVWEMVAGQVQVGDHAYQPLGAATQPVAGDPRPVNPEAPSYAALRGVTSITGDNTTSDRTGSLLTATVNNTGKAGADPGLGRYNVHAGHYVAETRHNIADRFWDYLRAQGLVYRRGYLTTEPLLDWVYVMGYPISEPVWTTARINGQPLPILVQLFQRRTLTYLPSADSAWQVQMGNVGQHYHSWRYP